MKLAELKDFLSQFSDDELFEYIDYSLDSFGCWPSDEERFDFTSDGSMDLIRTLEQRLIQRNKSLNIKLNVKGTPVLRRQRERENRDTFVKTLIATLKRKHALAFKAVNQPFEPQHVVKCGPMLPDPLCEFILSGLEQQDTSIEIDYGIPNERRTYEALINILARKLQYESKEGHIQKRSSILDITEIRKIADNSFARKEKLLDLVERFTNSFNRLNQSKLRVQKIVQKVLLANSFSNVLSPEIQIGAVIWKICDPFILEDICFFIDDITEQNSGLPRFLLSVTLQWHAFQPLSRPANPNRYNSHGDEYYEEDRKRKEREALEF
ncbi:MAG: hypothetical protein ABIP78_07250 [Pyrinomonadaceae bacterium]